MSKATGLIVPHTHWDREWRYPIWKNRMLLIEFMEQLLNILDTDLEYSCFVLDGQAIVIEDYLLVKPENTEKVKKYIKAGRIKIGPWYTLPDLFPLNGESLIRNLEKGLKVCEKLGGNLKVGYNSFGWGQTAQFPQIYAQFNFDFIIAAKNISKERSPHSEFMWESPDGTQVLTTRLGEHARANFFMNAYIPIMYNAIYTSPDYQHSWGKRGTTYHPCNNENYHNDHFKIKGRTYIHPAHIQSAIEKAWAGTDETLYKDVRLLMNGSDFSTPQPLLTNLIKQANEIFEDKEFKHSTIEEYADILRKNLDESKLTIVKGEMRDGPSSSCSSNALATRPKIKQLNKKVENAIFKIAEPFITMAKLVGYKPHTEFMEIAFDYMLKAHAHDSINGVTQDKTADDTIYNLNQALEIANTLANDALGFIVRNADTSAYNEDDVLITVFNPSTFDRNEIIKVFIDIPQEMSIWDFDIIDENDTIFEVQHISRKEVNVPVHELDSRPWPFYVDRQEVYFDTGVVLAGGYKTYKIKAKSTFNRSAVVWAKMRENVGKNISTNTTEMENDNLKVSVNANGSINVFDKAQNKEYTNLNYYEETGDCGDYWVYYPPYHNKTYTTKGANAEIWVEDNGSLSATIGTKIILNVPKDAEKPYKGYVGKSKRSDELTQITITTYYTLTRNSKSVEVKTIIDNTALDHRMKVLFDGNVKTEYSISAGHFTLDKREIANKYPEMQTYPVGAFTGVDGLSIISNCFSEAETTQDGCIKMSLFRGVRNVICSEFRSVGVFENQNGGQSLGELEFHYAIYPHSANWENGAFLEYEKHQTKLYPIQTCYHEGVQPLKMTDGYYKLEGENLVVSALKADGDIITIRLFNPTNDTVNGTFLIKNNIISAKSVKLNGDELEELIIENNKVIFNVGKNKIYTMKLQVEI